MKIKAVVLGVFIVVALLTVTIVIRTAPSAPQDHTAQQVKQLEKKQAQGRLNLREAAELAKAKGERRIVAPSLATLYLGTAADSDELDKKLSDFTVLTAKLVDQKSYVADEAVVRTWNKFAVVETLSQAPPRPTYFSWPAVPEELLPVGADEFLVHAQGGAVTVDGVEVAQADADVPAFRKSRKYLLVLSLDPGTRIGWLELGPQSLLPINDDETLDAGNDKHLLQQVIKDHHGGSVQQLKDRLKNRPQPQ